MRIVVDAGRGGLVDGVKGGRVCCYEFKEGSRRGGNEMLVNCWW